MADRTLLGWLSDPSGTRGIRYAAAADRWDFWSYQRLATAAHGVAAALPEYGVRPGDVVTVVSRGGPDFVAALFGALLAGATASPLAAPAVFRDADAYAGHLTAAIAAAGATAVLTDDSLVAAVSGPATAAGARATMGVGRFLAAASGAPELSAPAKRADLALVQFTSGSSGRSRPIRVPYAAVEANVAAIRGWLGMDGVSATASWLPVHHDMGLVGCLLTPIVDGSDLWLLSPEQFIQNPLRYLRCFGERRARQSAMPAFGLAQIVRRVTPQALSGLDFAGWAALIVGAERIEPTVLDGFTGLLAPFGFRPRAVRTAYGLAEATLAVTGLPMDEAWPTARVDPGSLVVDGVARPATGTDAVPVVGCGRPLAGVTVDVVGHDGAPLPEGRVGEIRVRGDSLAAGYAPAPVTGPSSTHFADGALLTGDAGFLRDGQLYVLGRLGDALKVRARTVFAEDLETALVAAGLPGHRVAAALGVHRGAPTAVVFLESPRATWRAISERVLRRRAEGAAVAVLDVPAGTIPRTSSGKPRRRALWRLFLADARSEPPPLRQHSDSDLQEV